MAAGMRERWPVNQTESIEFFNKPFPGDVAVFIFDYSGGHACKAKDGNRTTLRGGNHL
jgi:hypothetical protein